MAASLYSNYTAAGTVFPAMAMQNPPPVAAADKISKTAPGYPSGIHAVIYNAKVDSPINTPAVIDTDNTSGCTGMVVNSPIIRRSKHIPIKFELKPMEIIWNVIPTEINFQRNMIYSKDGKGEKKVMGVFFRN